MTSKLNRERLQEIAEDGFLKHGESKELARMALDAMGSEPVILYRQVNPVNGMKTYWAELDPEEFRHLKQHTDENAEFITLYRHAQSAPVVPDDLLSMAASSIEDLLEHTDPNTSYYSGVWADMPGKLRAAMLQAGNSPVIQDGLTAGMFNSARALLDALYEFGPDEIAISEHVTNLEDALRNAAEKGPVIGIDLASGPDRSVEVSYIAPPGYVMVPKDLLSELRDWAHPEIEKYCEMWEGRRDSEFPALRKVIADADALLAAAPQEVK